MFSTGTEVGACVAKDSIIELHDRVTFVTWQAPFVTRSGMRAKLRDGILTRINLTLSFADSQDNDLVREAVN